MACLLRSARHFCDSSTVEWLRKQRAAAQVDEAARGMKDTLDTMNPIAPPQARSVEEAGKYTDEQMDDALPKQQNPAQ